MKKVWLALAGMILAFSASAAQITDGKQYITLDKPIAGEQRALHLLQAEVQTGVLQGSVLRTSAQDDRTLPHSDGALRPGTDKRGSHSCLAG